MIRDYSRGLKISATLLPPTKVAFITFPGARGLSLDSAHAFIHTGALEARISSSETLQNAESAPQSRSLDAR